MDGPLHFNRNKGRPPIVTSSDDMDLQETGTSEIDAYNTTNVVATPTNLQHMSGIGPQLGPLRATMSVTGNNPQLGSGRVQQIGGAGPMMGGAGQMMGGTGPMIGGTGQIMGGAGPMIGGAAQMMGGAGQLNRVSQMMNGSRNVSSMGGLMSGDMQPGLNMPMTGYIGGEYDFMMEDPYLAAPPQEVDGKEILHFSGFVLVPPPPHAAPRSTREKPPGCKTLFIGGLPETVTEEMIGELMQTCGNFETIRLGKKHFAHIRFIDYDSVDKAIFYSGWRMKIGEKDDKPNTGRIHCDYATARDDQYEWECMQRTIEREQRHHRRMIEDMNRPPSPPQVARYSESEASGITEKLKSSQGFAEAAGTLMEWLDKGQVNSRNANRFYTMIHCVQSSVRRLTAEKEEFEQELENYKAQYKIKVTGLVSQMEQIQNVFSKARQQKVWDHFSKPQRKNLELWTSQCQELKQKHDDELLAERKEDEMDLSDSESTVPAAKKLKLTVEAASNMNKLSDENDSLKCQLEAYKNELDMNKMEAQTEKAQKSKQIAMLQQTLKGMQQQLMSTRNEVTAVQQKYSKLLSESGATDTAADEENTKSEESGEHEAIDQKTKEEDVGIVAGEEETTSVVKAEPLVAAPDVAMKEEEGKLLGLVVCFLNVHPFGASVDSIVSYLKLGGLSVDTNHVTSLLDSFPNIFFPKISGLGVDFEKLWTFNGFSPIEKT